MENNATVNLVNIKLKMIASTVLITAYNVSKILYVRFVKKLSMKKMEPVFLVSNTALAVEMMKHNANNAKMDITSIVKVLLVNLFLMEL